MCFARKCTVNKENSDKIEMKLFATIRENNKRDANVRDSRKQQTRRDILYEYLTRARCVYLSRQFYIIATLLAKTHMSYVYLIAT